MMLINEKQLRQNGAFQSQLIFSQLFYIIIISNMKNMTCINHKQADLLCLNLSCQKKCAYICSEGKDNCREDHQACTIASLSYLQRKCNQISAKGKQFKIDKLVPLHQIGKQVFQQIGAFLEASILLNQVRNILDPNGLLESKQKEKVDSFFKSKLKKETQMSLATMEKDLTKLNAQISNFLIQIRQDRKKQEEIKSVSKVQGELLYPSKSKVMPSAVKSGLKQNRSSKIKEDIQTNKEIINFQLVAPSNIRKSPSKPPLFSQITNDIKTLNTFFYHKISKSELLYRASQNDFSVNKFHQKCNGIKSTLTLVLTQFDKVIGGYTRLAWKSGGGQWYEDEKQQSFLFSLTSGQRYPLIHRQKAIWCSQAFGPSFGHPDLQIADKSFYNSNSCANFPQCYNNGNYTISSGSTQMFCGTKTGHFKIKQWEVYQLTF